MKIILSPKAKLRFIGAMVVYCVSAYSYADSLGTTMAGGNGQNGNMFDIAATGTRAITITGFSQNFMNAMNIPSYQVWVSYSGVSGNTTNAAAWTLLGTTGSFLSNPQGTPTRLNFTSPIALRLNPGQRVGIYLTNVDVGTSRLNSYTNGSAVGRVAATNSLLTIYEGYGKKYEIDFSGTDFFPRIWNGFIFFDSGPSTADTQQSLVNTASVLQGTFTLQNTVMVNGFTYDCPVFDKNGICVSAGGRNTTVQTQGINNTNGLLIASYRLNQNNTRIGAWIDQNLSTQGPGTVQLGNSTPMIGLFGVWSQRPDGVGAEVKVSAAYGQKDITVTRQVVGTSEAGSGGSQLISQGAQVVAKYVYPF